MRLPACEGWTRLVDEPNDIYAMNRSRIHGWLARMHGRVRDRPSLFRRYDNPCPAQPFPRFFFFLLSIFLRFRSNDFELSNWLSFVNSRTDRLFSADRSSYLIICEKLKKWIQRRELRSKVIANFYLLEIRKISE